MVFINILNLNSDNSKIQVSVETDIGFNIDSVKLWTNKNYKQSSFVDLSFKLKGDNNKEVFTISTEDINEGDLNGIFFVEFTSNSTNSGCEEGCKNSVIGVTANFSNIKNSILNDILRLEGCNTNLFQVGQCGTEASNIIHKDALLKALCDCLSFGYYNNAIDIYNSLLKLTELNNKCDLCDVENVTLFKSLGFGILDNNLILS